MIYQNILPAKFISRPNRFIAHILLEGKEQICHVKNTGRCKELLIPGCNIFVQKSNSPKRKTEYDLISVEKGGRLINMDSAAPNQVFAEYAASGGLGFRPDILLRERQFADSRFDFYLEHKEFWEIDQSWDGFSWINDHDNEKSVISFMRKSKKKNDTNETIHKIETDLQR